MSLLRFFVFILVAVPLVVIVGWPHPWWVTLLIGLSGGGAGYGVEAFFGRARNSKALRAAEPTDTDRAWQKKMELKRAIAAENRRHANFIID